MKILSLDEFKETTKENPKGFTFKVICTECNSEKVGVRVNDETYTSQGCDSCGWGGKTSHSVDVLFKCTDCGNAFHKKYELEE